MELFHVLIGAATAGKGSALRSDTTYLAKILSESQKELLRGLCPENYAAALNRALRLRKANDQVWQLILLGWVVLQYMPQYSFCWDLVGIASVLILFIRSVERA